MKNSIIRFIFTVTLIFVFNNAGANEQKVGEYTVHYNLFNSSVITAEVATQYNLKRNKNIALLNISVVRNSVDDDKVIGVVSNVFGQGSSLSGQHKGLAFKEIKEETAIYYIAQVKVFHGERLSFDIKVQPEKQGKLIPISFKQQIFIE